MVAQIKENRWSKKFAYTLSLSHSPDERYRAMFVRAMDAWEEATCIEFELAPNANVDHLVFIESNNFG